MTSFLSVWYIVAFTTERFILVCFPNKRRKVCTPQVAQAVVIFLTCFALAFYSFAPTVTGVLNFLGHKICAPMPNFIQVSWILNNLDTLLTLLIPVIIILGCNIRIARLVCTFYKADRSPKPGHFVCKWDFTGQSAYTNLHNTFHRQSYTNVTTLGVTPQPSLSGSKSASNYQIKATRMLLIVSTVFLVCNLPTHVARCYAFIMNLADENYTPTRNFILWQKFFQIIYYINFSVNFFLYSFSSRSFRLGFRRLSIKARSRASNLCKNNTSRNHSREKMFHFRKCSQLLNSSPMTVKEAETAA